MKTKYLDIVLLEDLPFVDLVKKIEKVFNVSLPYENKKGRYIAEGQKGRYKIELIDRFDDLSELLCDEHHVLSLSIHFEEEFNYIVIENEIKKLLKNYDIKWKFGIWKDPSEPIEKNIRKIFPLK
ncbi:hypothetical protein ACQKNB_16505 [Lysinibacillus xylanilyticus]|uniref:hypothetical protein n=1 Tax=Lysinibacillus xylanilyticus TaxID=582475 RepID=UPI003D0279CA